MNIIMQRKFLKVDNRMGDVNLKLFFVNPCMNLNEKLVKLPLFLFSLFPHKLRRQSNPFKKKIKLKKV